MEWGVDGGGGEEGDARAESVGEDIAGVYVQSQRLEF
jgi:hypothetical protein